MCGIFGLFCPQRELSGGAAERAVKALIHRGPDNQKTWVDPRGKVALGHARLSIIDLATGEQPLTDETGEVVAVVNGELYDFERIRADLQARGHSFKTKSDSEILLHLYQEQGVHCFEQLRGEFAFILWDRAQGRLFAARDRMGIKPLFYAWHDGALYLGSEAKALFAAGVPARWDEEALLQSCQAYLPADRTLFKNVLQVPPGHFLLASDGAFEVRPYWDFDYEDPARFTDGQNPTSDAEWVERTRDAIDEAVRLRLRADVPVGIYLSGGIDSCAVLGFARRHTQKPMEAFTVAFQGEGWEEEQVAEEMARHANAHFHPWRVTDDELADNFADAVFHSEILPANESGVAKYLLSERVRKAGIRVVLTGDGGDEVFAGYANFRRDLLLEQLARAPADSVARAALDELIRKNKASRGTQFPVGGPALPLDAVQKALGTVPSWIEAFASLGARMNTLLDDARLKALGGRDPYRSFVDSFDPGQLSRADGLQKAQYTWAKTYFANYIIVWLGDRAEMAHSVEGRPPLLDQRVVDLARLMPTNLKIRGGLEKYVLRAAAEPYVTRGAFLRPKHPFTAPPSLAKPKSKLSLFLQDTLRGPSLDSLPWFDGKKVRALLDRVPSMPEDEIQAWCFPLMRVLGAAILQQRFKL